MCTREEIKSIIDKSVQAHEQKEYENHLALMDKFEHTISMVRDSIPPSLSDILFEINNSTNDMKVSVHENGVKLNNLEKKLEPVVDAIDGARIIKKATMWLAGLLLSIYPIIEAVKYTKNSLK